MENLENIAQNLMIIAGIIMYILGIIGNIFNICVFTLWSRSPRTINQNNDGRRTSNSSLYLLTSSWANLIVIIYPLLTRIIFYGYQYRVEEDNVFILCKLRYYVLFTSDLISLTCICLAILDRYLISSREVRLRRLSLTREKTKLVIFGLICLIGLHGIPLGVYFEVSNLGQCIIFSSSFSFYYLYVFQILLHGIFPVCFYSIFGILTYKQLKMLKIQRNINVDKQFSRMLLLTSIAIVLSSVPYCTEQLYYSLISDSDQVSSIVFLYQVIASLLFYSNAVTSFYIYFISTPNFRRQIWKFIQCNRVGYHFNNQINVRTVGE